MVLGITPNTKFVYSLQSAAADLSITVCLLTKWNIIKKKKRC